MERCKPTKQEYEVHNPHDDQGSMVREWMEGIHSKGGNIQELIQGLVFSSSQKEIEAYAITEQNLKDKETKPPGTNSVVKYGSKLWEMSLTMLPMS